MNEDIRERYRHYQTLMSFLCEELPSKGWSVMVKGDPDADEDTAEHYDKFLDGDKRENLVRAFLSLPTVQDDRKVADELVREIQAKAKKK